MAQATTHISEIPLIEVRQGLEGLVVDINGFHVASSVIDRDYFERDWFQRPGELEVISGLEGLTQEILRDLGPRKYSGLYPYSHIDRVLETVFKSAKEVGVKLDFITVLASIGHDTIEDDPEVTGLLNDWKQALLIRDDFGNLEERYEEVNAIGDRLQKVRVAKLDNLRQKLYGYIPRDVRGSDREALRRDIDAAVRIMYQVTRFPDERPYALSMGFQYRTVSTEDIEQTLRRTIVKNSDITSNNSEFEPFYSPSAMGQIGIVFNPKTIKDDYNIGEEFSGRFGSVREEIVTMPAAIRVGCAVNALFPLYFQNITHDGYGKRIEAGEYGDRAKQLLKLAEHSKHVMIDATVNLSKTAKDIYEEDEDVKAVKGQVTDRINEYKETTYFFGITPDGFIRTWLALDAGGSEVVEGLEATPEGRIRAYTDARELLEIIPKFGKFHKKNEVDGLGRPILIEDPDVKYDPKIHEWYKISGMDVMLNDPNLQGVRFWDMVRRTLHTHVAGNGTNL